MRMASKRVSEGRHAQRRAAQRYDLHLTQADLDKIVGDIQHGRAAFVERQSNRVTVWDVVLVERMPDLVSGALSAEHHFGTVARVIYDKQRKQIVSFLLRGG